MFCLSALTKNRNSMASELEITADDFARMVKDALPVLGIICDETATADLTMGTTHVKWRYPAVIHGTKGGKRLIVVPRFGGVASVPGHLKKYLHACRTQLDAVDLYMAMSEPLWPSYRPLCEMFGLGALVFSMDDGRLQLAAKPKRTNIDRAFERHVKDLLRRARKAKVERLQYVDEARSEFAKKAAEIKGLGIESHMKRFEDLSEEVNRTYRLIGERAKEVIQEGSVEALAELASLVDELGTT